VDVLFGRSLVLEALAEAQQVAGRGGVALLSLTGEAGSGKTRLVDEFARRLGAEGLDVRRAAAFESTESEPGGVGHLLGLGGEVTGALLVDDAQWMDATSAAMLRSAMAKADRGLVVLLAHTPDSGYRRFARDRLVEAANRLGKAWEIPLERLRVEDLEGVCAGRVDLAEQLVEASGGLAADTAATLDAWEAAGAVRVDDGTIVATGSPFPPSATVFDRLSTLDRDGRRLAELLAVAGGPVTVAIAATVLSQTQEHVLDLGEHLATLGLAGESAEGFTGNVRVGERIGAVRRSALVGSLADAECRHGIDDRDPGLVGGHFLQAARWSEAFPLLARAGLDKADRQHFAEAYPLVDGALRAYVESAADDPVLEGRLRLARASAYRLAGWSDLAAEDLDVAVGRLSGVERVHALGYAGQVADDRQLPQQAERILAEGLLEATLAGKQGMVGSLLTLHARTLARLGFAREADAELDKGQAILESAGTDEQRARGRYNASWVAFDRGRAADAEAGFARLVDESPDAASVLADREAWWARALFMAGRPDDALEARTRSIRHADLSAGPVFLAHMALAEGALGFGAWEVALEAADETLSLVMQQLPAWENSARYLRARALLGSGRIEEAEVEAHLARDACPEGVDGRRWRLHIRVVEFEIAAAKGEAWQADEAFDLTDELLQSEWYLSAARLLVLRSKVEKDPSLGMQAMALATQLGVPDVAAQAADAAGAWKRTETAAVIASVKTMAGHVPDEWREGWEALPEVLAAIAAPDVGDEAYQEASERLSGQLERTLEQAGLGVEGRLISPAQRRARGLKRPRRPFHWTPIRVAASFAAVAVLGLGGGFLARAISPPPTTVATVPIAASTTAPPTTVPPEIWEIELGPPGKDIVTGQWSFGGDVDDQGALALNTGASSRTGVRRADGFYWKYTTGGRIESSPAVFGENVLFASEDGSLYGIAMASGVPPLWTEDSSREALVGSPTLAFFAGGNSQVPSAMRVYYGSTDGVLRIRDAGNPTAQVLHVPREGQFEGQIVSAPMVIGDTAYVGTTAGVMHAVSTSDPFPELWSADLGSPILATPAAADGTLYVGTEGGVLWAVDEQSGEATRCYESGDTIVTSPVIAGDTVFIPARDAQNLYAVQVGSCVPAQGIFLYQKVTSSPAYADGVLYVANGNLVQAYDATTRELIWQYPSVDSASHLGGTAGWPVVADGVLYFTTDEPFLYAVDLSTQELLWRYQLDGRVVNRPAVMNGSVVVGDLSGTVVAIGCSDPPDCG
jgi:outer membrane protein assembly factor BamB/tetratricopeptide (TPR) repeat protein